MKYKVVSVTKFFSHSYARHAPAHSQHYVQDRVIYHSLIDLWRHRTPIACARAKIHIWVTMHWPVTMCASYKLLFVFFTKFWLRYLFYILNFISYLYQQNVLYTSPSTIIGMASKFQAPIFSLQALLYLANWSTPAALNSRSLMHISDHLLIWAFLIFWI